jgi:thiosulfate/3-mercaptopyruvate sulfurtransferase
MKFSTLISVQGLVKFLNDPNWVIVDCRFSLSDPDSGYENYCESHIPGAVYAHLENHLSGEIIPGETGRHPLPEINSISKLFGSWGIDNQSQVVAYDDQGGMIAGRLWWLLQWLGHKNVAVLDGGFPAWIESGQQVNTDIPYPDEKEFTPIIRNDMVATVEDILRNFGDPNYILVDSRAPERYQGVEEPIDPIAGRIPGAINHFWSTNLDPSGYFIGKDILRGRLANIFDELPTEHVTFYCGSGVTAAHNVLAAAHAGLGMAKLYPGSWSHWITNDERPIIHGGRG